MSKKRQSKAAGAVASPMADGETSMATADVGGTDATKIFQKQYAALHALQTELVKLQRHSISP